MKIWLFILGVFLVSCGEVSHSAGAVLNKFDSIPDNYPLYPGCETYFSPEMQKWCFRHKFSEHLEKLMTQFPPDSVVLNQLKKDTLWLVFRVDTAGYIHTDTLFPVDSTGFTSCKKYFQNLTREIPPMEPALEKGLPVEVTFKLPVIFKE